MSNISPNDWLEFKDHFLWKEVLNIIKARMALITQNLIDIDICNSMETLSALQSEYKTCLWFLNLPTICATEVSETKIGSNNND
jgi:hypothetical protein